MPTAQAHRQCGCMGATVSPASLCLTKLALVAAPVRLCIPFFGVSSDLLWWRLEMAGVGMAGLAGTPWACLGQHSTRTLDALPAFIRAAGPLSASAFNIDLDSVRTWSRRRTRSRRRRQQKHQLWACDHLARRSTFFAGISIMPVTQRANTHFPTIYNPGPSNQWPDHFSNSHHNSPLTHPPTPSGYHLTTAPYYLSLTTLHPTSHPHRGKYQGGTKFVLLILWYYSTDGIWIFFLR